MPIRNVPDTDLQYHLVCYDRRGRERCDDPDAPGGRLCSEVLATLDRQPLSDVFVFSHGWLGDVPGAIRGYDRWLGAMVGCEEDLRLLRQARPDFHPLLIGLHWPSMPFGNEDLTAEVSFGSPSLGGSGDLIGEAAAGIADSSEARQALETILAAAIEDKAPEDMPQTVIDAYQVLWAEADLDLGGLDGAPGDEGEAFDPEGLYEDSMIGQSSFGGGLLGGLLAPLRPLSFWKMKQRARHFGETAGADLLRSLQQLAAPSTRFHMMGHSFGCIVMSATVAGADGDQPLPRPVDSMFLAQGALSCWSYTPEIPIAAGKRGYFRAIPLQSRIAGPLVTTQSKHDRAVGTAYPLATSAKQVSFAPGASAIRYGQPPRADGALGAFGLQGPGIDIVNQPMLGADEDYDFQPGTIYNLESSAFIANHSAIATPEVAHAFWSAVRTPSR